MSLYRCTKCDVVENTALGGYWLQQMAAAESSQPFRPLCSQCNPDIGVWHGQFPREGVTGEWLVDNRGFLWRPDQIKGLDHLGPFSPVSAISEASR